LEGSYSVRQGGDDIGRVAKESESLLSG
jgi:hypothetical protein